MSHCVYKHLDAHGEVLYVGLSRSLTGRLRSHERHSAWFPMVKNIEVLHCASLKESQQKEKELILSLTPRFNVQYIAPAMDFAAQRRLLIGEKLDLLRALMGPAINKHGEKVLAKHMGVSIGTVSNFLREEVVPALKTVEKVEQFFSGQEASQPKEKAE